MKIAMNTEIITQLQKNLTKLRPKLQEEMRLRNEFNQAAQRAVKKRNKFNSKVKVLDLEAKELQAERNSHNQSVRKYKKKRKQITNELREIKKKVAQSSDEQKINGRKLIDLNKAHDEAHENVQNEANLAQEKHDLMLEKNTQTNELRIQANDAHRQLRQSKQKADLHHKRYIIITVCQKSCRKMLEAIETQEQVESIPEEQAIEKLNSNLKPIVENNDDLFDNAGL
mgnify:CR=1 FL=1|jgi:uncharacterized coiled-coil DUF342 family protein